MNRTPVALLLALSVLSLGLVACDSATPVAPTDSVITLTANPLTISGTGTSNLTIEARKPNGQAVNPGTEIRLSTTLGTLSSEVVTTDDAGIARATLTGDGRLGEANVVARSGASSSEAVMVTIGRLAGSVTLQANPANVRESGGTVDLLALVRDSQGQPVGGVPCNFRTTSGTLRSGGNFVNTDNQGRATDRLTVSELDTAIVGDNFMVSVQASGSGGASQSAEATITVARPPVASFDFAQRSGTREVTFTDRSTGGPTSWSWDFDFRPEEIINGVETPSRDSDSRNPTTVYGGSATEFTVRLEIHNGIAPTGQPCGTCVFKRRIVLTNQQGGGGTGN